LDIEVAQTLRRLTLLKEITAARGSEAIEDCGALSIQRTSHQTMMRRIWELKDSITAYDAAYVALAEALDAPLLTCDSKLARSHGHRARIELVS
jgi:predicted nucleic acid-binding protein